MVQPGRGVVGRESEAPASQQQQQQPARRFFPGSGSAPRWLIRVSAGAPAHSLEYSLAAPLAAPSAQTPSRTMKATLALALLLAAAACGSPQQLPPQYRQPSQQQPQSQPQQQQQQQQGAPDGTGAPGREGSVFTNEAIRQAQQTYLIPKDATIQKVQEGIELAAYEHIPGDQRINLFEILGAHVPPEVVNNLQAQVDQIGKQ